MGKNIFSDDSDKVSVLVYTESFLDDNNYLFVRTIKCPKS